MGASITVRKVFGNGICCLFGLFLETRDPLCTHDRLKYKHIQRSFKRSNDINHDFPSLRNVVTHKLHTQVLFPIFENLVPAEKQKSQIKNTLVSRFFSTLSLHSLLFFPRNERRKRFLEIRNLEISRAQSPSGILILDRRVTVQQKWGLLIARDQHASRWSPPHRSQRLVAAHPQASERRCHDVRHSRIGDGS